MTRAEFDNFDDRLDQATADRLAKLRTAPVDTTRLANRLRQQIPQPMQTRQWLFRLRAVRFAAASILIAGIILAVFISSPGGPALASADTLAAVHEEMTGGTGHVMKVSSMEAASAALNGQWPKVPDLPDVADDHVMACCVHEVGRRKMACVALTVDDVPITMAVANSAEVRLPAGRTMQRDGVTWHVDSSKGVNMAMTERGGRWVCLMGRVSVERLIDAASELRFRDSYPD